MAGGGSGIRTRDTVSRIHTFQACAFNHSATPPLFVFWLKELASFEPIVPLSFRECQIFKTGGDYNAAGRKRKLATAILGALLAVVSIAW
jgi:hypothetical protein